MARWASGARGRLERAALELFLEQGFAATTVPQITARAGLTTRTFFRHFADKREVLFAGEDELPALVERLMIQAPAALGPVGVIASGLEPFARAVFGGGQGQLRARKAVINGDEGLRERELRKLDTLTGAIRRGFLRRGSDDLTAALAAEMAMAVFRVAVARWLDQEGERGLAEIAAETLGAFQRVATDAPAPARSDAPILHP